MRLKKYGMDKNSWNKFAIITRAQLLRFFPPQKQRQTPKAEFFPNFNFCKFGKEKTARYFPKGSTVLSALRNFRYISFTNIGITVLRLLRTFVSDWSARNMDPALICLDKRCIFDSVREKVLTPQVAQAR